MTLRDLSTMDKDAVWSYEHRKLGFIAPVFDAITHADNIREDIRSKSVAPDAVMGVWSAKWTFDNARQLRYFQMIAKHRGYFCYEIERNQFGPRLETRLTPNA